MKKRSLLIVFCFFVAASNTFCRNVPATFSLTVTMEKPNTHYYHIVFRCEGLKGPTQDFKIPAWTPGYYRIMDFAKNVVNFRAEDGFGNPLFWEKTSKNTWQVKSGRAETIIVSYDVYAYATSVADSFLDDSRAYISPACTFMHVAERLRHPVTVTVKPYQNFGKISTGLDPVAGDPNTFFAPNFDVLYDSPIFVGNQEIMSFDVQGIPHTVAIVEPGDIDRKKFASILKKMVESAVAVVGEIPYRHYTFILMGEGQGGLEHQNSMAVFTKVPNLDDPNDYKGWLSFMAHEYFHLYNVKAIRPIALGPFDYDKENYTNMLWFSEGGTVYYEYLILNRAGFLTRDECIEKFRKSITGYETVPGHLFQSATQSSFDAWIQSFFGRGGNAQNTTVSYYDKGCALTMLLDLKIRNETKNKKSLDDVMRILYQRYYKEKKRGFTDGEFREVCEFVAGCSLSEIFDFYVATTKDIDYPKYLAYAGLDIDVQPKELGGAYLGATFRERGDKLVISSVEWNSPAYNADLGEQQEITAVDGNNVNLEKMNEMLDSKKPGDKILLKLSHHNKNLQVEIVLGKKTERTFNIKPISKPNLLQSAILNDWLKK
jgi:predicted metalloprotease with PDZ domain